MIIDGCELMTYAAPDGCDRCGRKLTGRRTRWCSDSCRRWFLDNHRWTNARRKARRSARWRCDACGSTERLEVNHIVPCIGRHGTIGCHHHQSNLQVLCHACHVAATAAQRAAGMFKKDTA